MAGAITAVLCIRLYHQWTKRTSGRAERPRRYPHKGAEPGSDQRISRISVRHVTLSCDVGRHGREVVTFACRNRTGGNGVDRRNGVILMTLIKSREPADLDKSMESAVEGDIRDFVRRDVATLRRQPEAESEAVANNIGLRLPPQRRHVPANE